MESNYAHAAVYVAINPVPANRSYRLGAIGPQSGMISSLIYLSITGLQDDWKQRKDFSGRRNAIPSFLWVVKTKGWEDRRMSCAISFFSFSPRRTSKDRICRIHRSESLKYSRDELESSLQARATSAELCYHQWRLSSNHRRSKWKLIFFYLLRLHFPFLLMFGNFLFARSNSQLGLLHLQRGGSGNKSGIKSERVAGFQDTFPKPEIAGNPPLA